MAKCYFQEVMGVAAVDSKQIVFQQIQLPSTNLEELESPFTEEEVWQAIKEMPNEKAPGLDGFTGMLYQFCWPIIKSEVMAATAKLHSGNSQNLEYLNTATITLLPKKEALTMLKDYQSMPHPQFCQACTENGGVGVVYTVSLHQRKIHP